jgi:hypothetical protein
MDLGQERLSFGICRQQCDNGGGIIIDRLPTPAEAETIRDILGIPKRIHLSETQLANLAAHRVPFEKRVEKTGLCPKNAIP